MAHTTDSSGLTGTGWTAEVTDNPDLPISKVEQFVDHLKTVGVAHGDGGLEYANDVVRMLDGKAKRVSSKVTGGAQRLLDKLAGQGLQHVQNHIDAATITTNTFATKVDDKPVIFGHRSGGNLASAVEPTLSSPPTHIDCHSFLPPHLYAVGVREMYLWLCADSKEQCFFCLNQPGEAIVESLGDTGQPFITGDRPPNPIHIIPAVQFSTKRFHTIDKYSTWYRCEFAFVLATSLHLNGINIRALHHAIEQVGLSTSATRGQPTSLADFVAQSGGQ